MSYLRTVGSKDYSEALDEGSIDFTISWEATVGDDDEEIPTFLRVHLKRAIALKATDTGFMSSGKSDPFVQVSVGGMKKDSKTIKATCDPLFDEYVDFEGDIDVFLNNGPLELHLHVSRYMPLHACRYIHTLELHLHVSAVPAEPHARRDTPLHAVTYRYIPSPTRAVTRRDIPLHTEPHARARPIWADAASCRLAA